MLNQFIGTVDALGHSAAEHATPLVPTRAVTMIEVDTSASAREADGPK